MQVWRTDRPPQTDLRGLHRTNVQDDRKVSAAPTGARSPAVWGTREWLQTTFGAAAYAVTAEPRHFTFRYRSAQHFLDIFGTCYGRMLKAFEMLEEAGGKALARDILDLVGSFNTSNDETMVVRSEYLEVTKR